MATTEGKTVQIHTEGVAKNALLGNARLSGSDKPASVKDVERIVVTVRDCFAKFIQEQLTYAAKETAAGTSGELDLNALAASQGTGASTEMSNRIVTIENNTNEIMQTVNGISMAASSLNVVKETTEKTKNEIKGFKGFLLGPINILKAIAKSLKGLSLKSILISLFTNPMFLVGMVLLGTTVYKFGIKPLFDKVIGWFEDVKSFISDVYDDLKELYDIYIKPVIEAASPYIEQLGDWLTEYGNYLYDFWSNFDLKQEWDNLINGGKELWDKVNSNLKDFWDWVTSAPGKIWTSITNGISNGIDFLKESISDTWEDFCNTFERWWFDIKKELAHILHPLTSNEELDANANSELIKRLNEEGAEIERQRKALEDKLSSANSQEDKDAILNELKKIEHKNERFQKKVSDYNLSDADVKEASKNLGDSDKNGAFYKATEANKTGVKMNSSAAVDSSAQNMLFEDSKLKASVDSSGNKTIEMTKEQDDELRARIEKVFAKNLERMEQSANKNGGNFDRDEAIRKLEEKIMKGIDILQTKTDKLKDGQLSDSDLKSALNYATRAGAKNVKQPKVVVNNTPTPPPTPPRSMHSNGGTVIVR